MATFLAVYKGDEVICVGSAQQRARSLGVKIDTIYYYLSTAYRKRLEKRDSTNAIQVFRYEDDEM